MIIDDFKPALLRTLKDHKRFVAAENSEEYRISSLHYCFNELLIGLTWRFEQRYHTATIR